MIYSKKDGSYIIDVDGNPYHVTPEMTDEYAEVAKRIAAGEEVAPDVTVEVAEFTQTTEQMRALAINYADRTLVALKCGDDTEAVEAWKVYRLALSTEDNFMGIAIPVKPSWLKY